jgi:hypothetical protein
MTGTVGVIVVEWNLKADGQAPSGLRDFHARIRSALGTGLTSTECPP